MPSWLSYVWKWVELVWIPVSTILGIVVVNAIASFLGADFESFTNVEQWKQLLIAAIVSSIRPALGAILALFSRR